MKRLYIFCLLLVLVLPLAVSTYAQAPAPAQEAPPAAEGGRVILRAGDVNTPARVPPPETFSPRAPETATIRVTYHGFSAQARTAFQRAVDIWETQISSPVVIEVDAYWESLGEGVLGAAGPSLVYRDFSGAPEANTWYPVALANALAGSDLSSGPDIEASFNSSFGRWYFGTDGNTPSGQYDFVSVVLHEIGHGLGFLGSMEKSGALGSWGLGPGYPAIYDRFVENGAGRALLSFPNNSTALGNQLVSNNLFFDGSSAVAGAGGTRPKLYAPNPWQSGSSYAHLDENKYPPGNVNSLMTPILNGAEANHNPGPITLGIFKDTGWTTATSPPGPTPTPTPTPSLSIDVYTDRENYSAGETQRVGLDLATDRPVRFLFLLWTSAGPVPFVDMGLPAGVDFSRPNLFSWEVRGIPAGTYAWVGVLVPAGGEPIVDVAVWTFAGSASSQDQVPVEEILKTLPEIDLDVEKSGDGLGHDTLPMDDILKALPEIAFGFEE